MGDYASTSRNSTLEDESATLVRELDELGGVPAARRSHGSQVLEDARAACVPRLSMQQQRTATLCVVFCALACDFALLTVVMSIFPTYAAPAPSPSLQCWVGTCSTLPLAPQGPRQSLVRAPKLGCAVQKARGGARLVYTHTRAGTRSA